jgi:type IV pilus assembly protein PilN
METIHKKNGRLHIYVRQDKYKGELKSHNFVGRTYINGKQKVSSSGTTNLEEAIPILEKWFDDLQLEKNDNISVNEVATVQNDDVSLEKDITTAPIQENTNITSPPSPPQVS